MIIIDKLWGRKKGLCNGDLALPFRKRARQALLREDLPKAIAYLDRGIAMAPNHLRLYLERAQIFQYGMGNYTRALQDYRHILRVLAAEPQNDLVGECKRGMRDMMSDD